MVSRRAWIIGATLGVAGAGSAFGVYKLTRKTPESVLVESRELRQTVVSSGQVMPPAEVSLESLITSNIVEIAKREGDEVKAGELLLRLDDRELNAAIAQAEAAVELRLATGSTRRGGWSRFPSVTAGSSPT